VNDDQVTLGTNFTLSTGKLQHQQFTPSPQSQTNSQATRPPFIGTSPQQPQQPRMHNQGYHQNFNHHSNYSNHYHHHNNHHENKPQHQTQSEVVCFKCGDKGHYANKCNKGLFAFLRSQTGDQKT
jgi:hypothetical protein